MFIDTLHHRISSDFCVPPVLCVHHPSPNHQITFGFSAEGTLLVSLLLWSDWPPPPFGMPSVPSTRILGLKWHHRGPSCSWRKAKRNMKKWQSSTLWKRGLGKKWVENIYIYISKLKTIASSFGSPTLTKSFSFSIWVFLILPGLKHHLLPSLSAMGRWRETSSDEGEFFFEVVCHTFVSVFVPSL